MGMAASRGSSPLGQRLDAPIEEWAYLGQEVLVPARSRKVCMTCH